MQEIDPYKPPKAPLGSEAEEAPNLDRVVKGQKLIIYAMLIYPASIAALVAVGPIAHFGTLAMLVVAIMGLIKLTGGLGMAMVWRVLICLSLVIPLVGLLVLLSVNTRATRVLKKAGYKVGLLGASGQPAAHS